MSHPNFPKPSIHTQRFLSVDESDFDDYDYILISENPSEQRGNIPVWNKIKKKNLSKVISIEPAGKDKAIFNKDDTYTELSLKDDSKILSLINCTNILIDVSGMPHQVWATLLRVTYNSNIHTNIMYAEPEEYKLHPSPASASLFDLTTSFEGLSPLPGFARLSTPDEDRETIMVVLLGFEGNRSKRLTMDFDYPIKLIPIVGVPGFQISFPEHTIACNRDVLKQSNSYSEIRFARASCPYEAYSTIEEIHKDNPGSYLYLAPVGTKPHSMGAIYYAIKNPIDTEILFDFPVKKSGRTKGVGLIHIYDFGELDAY